MHKVKFSLPVAIEHPGEREPSIGSSDDRVLISRWSTENELPLTLPDDVSPVGHLRGSPDPVVVTVARPGAGWSIIIQIFQVLSVQALGAGLLESRVALALPLHWIQLVRLPVVGEVPGGAGRVPVGVALISIVASVGVIAGGLLVPECRRGHGHVDGLRLPVGVSVPVPAHRDTVVVERALGQRVDVLVGQVAGHRVGVQALLVIHDPVHWVLPPRLSH